jgi:aspartate aminotransferase-like enzyme
MKARKLLMIPGPIEFEPEVYKQWNGYNESCGSILLKFSETVLSL